MQPDPSEFDFEPVPCPDDCAIWETHHHAPDGRVAVTLDSREAMAAIQRFIEERFSPAWGRPRVAVVWNATEQYPGESEESSRERARRLADDWRIEIRQDPDA